MLVTCCICKKKIEKDTAYKIRVIGPISGKETIKNCCSEQEWQEEEERKKKAKEDKDKVYYLICDMFGYEIQHTKFFDEWACWNKLKSNEMIYKYIRENETYLQQVCDKPFENEYQKIRYFSAILKNNLRDFEPQAEIKEVPKVTTEEVTKVMIEETIYNATPSNTRNRRRGLSDLEDDI